MSDHGAHDPQQGHTEHTHHGDYVRIWAILLLLLVVSVAGPLIAALLHNRSIALGLTLFTAFGIAVVKAYMVAKNFMHINVTERFIPYLVMTMLVFMVLFYAGTSPDVMKLRGRNWEKPAWIEANAEAAAHHGTGHGGQAHH